MKSFFFAILTIILTGYSVSAQQYKVQGNNTLWDLKVLQQSNKPCALATYDYFSNANSNRLGLSLQQYNANGTVSQEFRYATNDPNFENIMVSKFISVSSTRYLVAGVVEASAANTFSGGYVMVALLDAANGNIMVSKAIQIPNVPGNKMWIGGIAYTGSTLYVSGITLNNVSNMNEVFLIKAEINVATNIITPNWIRSYYTNSLPFNGPTPSIIYDTQFGRIILAQADDTGQALLLNINGSSGSIVSKKLINLAGKQIKEVKLGFSKVGAVYYRCLIARLEDNAGNSFLSVARLNNSWIMLSVQKFYALGGKWEMTSVDFQQNNGLVGAVKTIANNTNTFNWLKFDLNNCGNLNNVSFTQNRQRGHSIFYNNTVFSVGSIVPGQPGIFQLVTMPPSALCETSFTITPSNSNLIPSNVPVTNGMNITAPVAATITLLKLTGVAATQQVCP